MHVYESHLFGPMPPTTRPQPNHPTVPLLNHPTPASLFPYRNHPSPAQMSPRTPLPRRARYTFRWTAAPISIPPREPMTMPAPPSPPSPPPPMSITPPTSAAPLPLAPALQDQQLREQGIETWDSAYGPRPPIVTVLPMPSVVPNPRTRITPSSRRRVVSHERWLREQASRGVVYGSPPSLQPGSEADEEDEGKGKEKMSNEDAETGFEDIDLSGTGRCDVEPENGEDDYVVVERSAALQGGSILENSVEGFGRFLTRMGRKRGKSF